MGETSASAIPNTIMSLIITQCYIFSASSLYGPCFTTSALQPTLYSLHSTAYTLQPTLYSLCSTTSTHSTFSALLPLLYYPSPTLSALQSLPYTQNKCGVSIPPSCPGHPQPQRRQLQAQYPQPVQSPPCHSPLQSIPSHLPCSTLNSEWTQIEILERGSYGLASIVCGLFGEEGCYQRSSWKGRYSVTISTNLIF